MQSVSWRDWRFAAQLDLCDELGLLVYEENYAAWHMQPSEALEEIFDRTLRQMILRDRNHPCVVIWGLLTNTTDGLVFKRAIEALPQAAFLDDTRLIALNSGRNDDNPDFASLSNPGSAEWNLLSLSGDIHLAAALPLTRAESVRIRALGEAGDHPVFISDWRMPGTVNLLETHRLFEKTGRSDSDDVLAWSASLEQIPPGLGCVAHAGSVWPAGRFLRSGNSAWRETADGRAGAIRANPRVIGLTTGMADDSSSGAGVLTAFRSPRPGAASGLVEGLSPLRWCLFAEPRFAAIGGKLQIEALLANDDALPAGMYPVLVQVFDSNSAPIFERRTILEIPGSGQTPLVLPVVAEELTIESTPGRYRLTATFEQGASAAADSLEFLVAPPLPPLPDNARIRVLGEDATLVGWLNEHHISFAPANAAEPGTPGEVVLVVTAPGGCAPSETFEWLAQRCEQGSTVISSHRNFSARRIPANG